MLLLSGWLPKLLIVLASMFLASCGLVVGYRVCVFLCMMGCRGRGGMVVPLSGLAAQTASRAGPNPCKAPPPGVKRMHPGVPVSLVDQHRLVATAGVPASSPTVVLLDQHRLVATAGVPAPPARPCPKPPPPVFAKAHVPIVVPPRDMSGRVDKQNFGTVVGVPKVPPARPASTVKAPPPWLSASKPAAGVAASSADPAGYADASQGSALGGSPGVVNVSIA